MSRLETPMTLRYWRQVGGTLIEEFCAVRAEPGVARRLIDGIIITGEPDRLAARGETVDLADRDVVVVQTKANALGMSLLGQALFSRVLIEERFSPRSARAVAVCRTDDAALRPLAEHFGIEVVVDDESRCSTCGAHGVPILYGLPGSEELSASERGELVVGGCVIDADSKKYECPTCRTRWGRLSTGF